MSKEDKSQQTETGNRQAVEVLKALSHFEYPGEVSQMQPWLEKTKSLQSVVKCLCEKDRSGRLTFDCVCALFEVMAARGEGVSPAVWDVLDLVDDDDDVKCLVEMFLKDHESQQLENGLLALIGAVCTCGVRIPKLQVWCGALIEALEEKQEYRVLQSVSQGVAFKLLQGIILPHSRKLAFSLFERLLYPMTSPQAFNSLIDHLPEALSAVENDETWERFAGLTKTLLERFPPVAGREESHKKLKLVVAKHLEGAYKPGYPVWNQKKPATELSSILECPVCYERFVTPITACENGHCICSNCKDRLNSCPICRGRISNIRMTIMDQIMEATEFPCKNFDAGCGVRMQYKDIWNHELDCEYRTVPCDIICSQSAPQILCNEDVVVLYFHEHMEKCHKEFVTEFELNSKRRGELRRQKANEVRLLKNSDGSLSFIERIYVTDDEIFFAYHYVGRSEDAKNYVYTLKINGGGPTQKIRYTNFCLPNYMGVFDTEVDERCLILEPEKIFYAQRTKFEYSVRIEEVNLYRMRLKKNKFLVAN